MPSPALPPVVDAGHVAARTRCPASSGEKAATRELDAIAAQRRRLPMVDMPDYTLEGADGPVRLAEVFDGRSQLIVYHHMWFPGEEWQCPGCTGFTAQFARLEVLDHFDARFVIVTQGPIDEALAYKRRVGNAMTWYSTANSPFGADVGAPPGGGVRRERVPPRRRHGVPHLAHRRPRARATRLLLRASRPVALRRQEDWQDSPEGWPQSPTYTKWSSSRTSPPPTAVRGPDPRPPRQVHLALDRRVTGAPLIRNGGSAVAQVSAPSATRKG